MEETDAMQQGIETESGPSDIAILLTQFLETNAESFMGILRAYISKAQLVSNEGELQDVALEVLDEVYIEAVKTASRFDPTRSFKPWLLGIAHHVVMRKRNELIQRRKRETTMSEREGKRKSQASDTDALEQFLALVPAAEREQPENQVEDSAQVEYLLSLVSENYRNILYLHIVEDMGGEALAQALNCTYEAALVRLSRARKQLRAALEKRRGESNG